MSVDFKYNQMEYIKKQLEEWREIFEKRKIDNASEFLMGDAHGRFFAYKDILDHFRNNVDLEDVSICQCESRDWTPFRIEQRVLCGKCGKPIAG